MGGQMSGNPITTSNHISRLCGGTTITEDGRITGKAFRLREDRNETYLSVNWLEFLKLKNRESEIKEIQKVFIDKGFTLGTKARFGVLNTGEVKEHVLSRSPDGRKLSILHEPLDDDSSHSGINGLAFDDELIGDLIAEKVIKSYPAKS